MHIVIAGGSGFLGRALTDALVADRHTVTHLSRSASPSAPKASPTGSAASPTSTGAVVVRHWSPDGEIGEWAGVMEGAAAVVNLAGDSIAEGRWTATKKTRVRQSRVLATRSLAKAIGRAKTPPAALVSGSAVGFYGALGDEIVTEERRAGSDFLANVCAAWEAEARAAETRSTRVVYLRTGLVLDATQGALPRMLLPFRLGVGGRLGSGRQYWPWIHVRDWVALARFVIESTAATGPINLTAPQPVTNAEFTRSLARTLRRPAVLPAPGFALRLALGEMADALLLSGQRAVPAAAERLGFRFQYPELDPALDALLRR